MKIYCLAVLLFIGQVSACYSQQVPEAVVYQLTNSILEGLRPEAISSAKKGADGKYYRRNMPTDTPTVRLLLLDRPYYHADADSFLLAKKGTVESQMLLRHFTPADLLHMQRQLPAMRQFKLDSSRIQQEWVTVLSSETLVEHWENRKKRFGNLIDLHPDDSLFRRYGSSEIFAISGLLFSLDKKRALVTVGYGYGWNLCVYEKGPAGWRRKGVLQSTVH